MLCGGRFGHATLAVFEVFAGLGLRKAEQALTRVEGHAVIGGRPEARIVCAL